MLDGIKRRLRWRISEAGDVAHSLSDRNHMLADFKSWNEECLWRRICFGHDSLTGWRYLPGLKARIYHDGGYYMLRTNSAGIRSDREYPEKIPSGRKRIILLGDSYSAGDGVDNGKRFSDLLEAKYPHLDVMNFALPGSGTDQQVLLYEHVACRYDADAILFCILDENIFRLRQTCWPAMEWGSGDVVFRAKPYFTLEAGQLVLKHNPVPGEIRTIENLGDWVYAYPESELNGKDRYEVYNDEASLEWRLMNAILERFTGETGTLPLVLAPLPTRTFLEGQREAVYIPPFLKFNSPQANRHVVDVLPQFLNLNAGDRRRCTFAADSHYSELGHQVVAEALEQALITHEPELLKEPVA